MNIIARNFDRDLTRDDAAEALAVLRSWVKDAAEEEVETLDPAIAKLLRGEAV